MLLRIVLIVCCLTGSQAVRPFDIVWTHFECTVQNTEYVTSFICTLTPQAGQSRNYVDSKLRFNRTINKMNIHFRVSVPRPLSEDYYNFNFMTDGCELNKVSSKNSALKAVLKRLKQVGNSVWRCPMMANFTYSIDRFALNPDHFPAYAPDMNFTIKMQFITEKSIDMVAIDAGVAVVRKKK